MDAPSIASGSRRNPCLRKDVFMLLILNPSQIWKSYRDSLVFPKICQQSLCSTFGSKQRSRRDASLSSRGTEQTPVPIFPTRHPGGVWSVPDFPKVANPIGKASLDVARSGSDQNFQERTAYCLSESAKSLPAQGFRHASHETAIIGEFLL